MAETVRIRIILPDGTHVEVPSGTSAGEVLSGWQPDHVGRVLAALWEGRPIDLASHLEHDGRLAPLSFSDRAGREILEHSSAHLVAKGLVETIPDAKPTHGPPTEEGFYYDFDVRPLTPEDLDSMRNRIRASVEAREPFHRREMS